jgi:CRISPR-associated helicase Cas3/CRISPR-associated endonuclease Cas3-HD
MVVDNNLPPIYLAHSGNRGGVCEPMAVHVEAVTKRATMFAAEFDAQDEARVAGLLHDLGKYSERFSARLRDDESGVDHWTVGGEAAIAFYTSGDEKYVKANVNAVQAAIRGHHIGLAAPTYRFIKGSVARNKALRECAKWAAQLGVPGDPSPDALLRRLLADGFSFPPGLPSKDRDRFNAYCDVAGMLDVRMLFSCLVDADYLETEAHFAGDSSLPRRPRRDGPRLEATAALDLVERLVTELSNGDGSANRDVMAMRRDLLNDCLAAAFGDRGLYTLTAPTGAGKTLAMLAFALLHAKKHEMRRVVSVIPFLTIIEQTAEEYRHLFENAFGGEFILEDHSQAGNRSHDVNKMESETEACRRAAGELRLRLLAENYDAPVVLCTSVQLLESLFAHRPRACRKLHRLANSVLLFDEVQTLPPELAVATLATVSRLVERYGCTAVFATATQPAFGHLHEAVVPECKSGWQPREIVRNVSMMFAAASRRTRVEWRLNASTPWETIAEEMAEAKSGLCVVNLKRHARWLIELLKRQCQIEANDLFHLSTSLCPAHRKRVLKEVKARLKDELPCLLVSTQCIEAGVDISFKGSAAGGPARAWRALAPLEAVAQTAGRVNRGGEDHAAGIITVFEPVKDDNEPGLYPPGYGQAAEFCKTFVNLCKQRGEDIARLIHHPELLNRYFRSFYDLTGKAISKPELMQALGEWDFEAVSREYRLIAHDTARVLVPYDRELYQRLRNDVLDGLDPTRARAWFAEAATLGVNVARRNLLADDATAVVAVGVGYETPDRETAEWFVLEDASLYDSQQLGLLTVASDVLIA